MTMTTEYEMVGLRKYKKIQDRPLGDCQASYITGVSCSNLGEFDTPTKSGPWAYLCRTHVQVLAPDNCHSGYYLGGEPA